MKPEDIFHGFQDHEKFCRESLIVEAENKALVPMTLGPGQLRLEAAIARQRKLGVPVRLIYLKSRRIQATTGTAARYFHDTAFNAGVHSAVMAHDATSTANIYRIYKRFHEKYKPFAGAIRLPNSRVLAEQIQYEYGGDQESSWIQIHTAGTSTFGRSFRLTNIHFSEFPYYPNPGETLAAVMSAVPKTPDTCAIVEGTAKTIGDFFHKMWQNAMDPTSGSEWIGLFMGWWEHPSNVMPLAVPADRFQEMLSVEERELMARYGLSLPQMAWRRWTIINDCNGDMQRFRREHPATPEEAFMASSRNRFSIPHVQRMPILRDPVVGNLDVTDIGAGEKRLAFYPNAAGGRLSIWRRPEKGKMYAIGADCAQGIDVGDGSGTEDPDFSVAQILDRDTGEQVAVLRARMMPGETGRSIANVGRWYNMAQICGERNPGGGGVSMLEAILNADYPPGLLYHRPVNPEQDPQVRSDKIGWDTTGVSRPILISLLDELLRQMAISVHDPVTQQELLTFIVKANGKAEAQTGCHDDCVIALALACIVITRMQRPLPVANMPRPELGKYGAARGDTRGERVRLR